jgi:hypothetical protein
MTGKVVDHNESGTRYAVSERNFNPKVHTFVRDLLPGETVLGYQPRRKGSLTGEPGTQGAPEAAVSADGEQQTSPAEDQLEGWADQADQTEGSSPEDTQDK